MSYPDLVEEGGEFFLTETQKEIARVHPVDRSLVEGTWGQFDAPRPVDAGVVLDLADPLPREAAMPSLPAFTRRSPTSPYGTQHLRGGISMSMWLKPADTQTESTLLNARSADGRGLRLRATGQGSVEILLSDGRTESRWHSDPGMLQAGQPHHVAAIVDAGPRVITFVVDGRLCDGGERRQFGWGRFNPHLQHVNGSDRVTLGDRLESVRMYDRYLRTSEAVALYRLGRGA